MKQYNVQFWHEQTTQGDRGTEHDTHTEAGNLDLETKKSLRPEKMFSQTQQNNQLYNFSCLSNCNIYYPEPWEEGFTSFLGLSNQTIAG